MMTEAERSLRMKAALMAFSGLITLTLLGAGVIFWLFVPAKGAGATPQSNEPILIEITLERTVTKQKKFARSDVVCKMRFLAEPRYTVSAFLPAGEQSGVALSFRADLSTKDRMRVMDLCSSHTMADADNFSPTEPNINFQKSSTNASFDRSGVGEKVMFTQYSRGNGNTEVEYKGYITWQGYVPVSQRSYDGKGGWRVRGETLHLTNAAASGMMEHGVTLLKPELVEWEKAK